MSPQQLEFSARIARINAGAMNTRTTVYVGMDDAFSFIPKARVVQAEGLIGTLQNAAYPLSFVMSLLIGIVAYALTVWFRFKLTGMPDPAADPTTEMGAMLAIGVMLAVVLGHIFGARGMIVAKTLGVAIGLMLFHNAVHAWPEPFALAFNEVWVDHIRTTTEANSLLFRGTSFTF